MSSHRIVNGRACCFTSVLAGVAGCSSFDNGCYGPCPPNCRKLEVEIAPALDLPYHAELELDGEAASFTCAAVEEGRVEDVEGVRMARCHPGSFVLLEAPDEIHVLAEEADGSGAFERSCRPTYFREPDTPYDCHCDQSRLWDGLGCPVE